MVTGDIRADLDAALVDLAELIREGERPGEPDGDRVVAALTASVAELRRRLREDRVRVLVVGESKRGKSTLTNALIGRAVLPMGVTPLTAVPTTLTYGRPERVRVALADGSTRIEPLGALAGLVTEDGNPGNRLGLAAVVVELDVPLLAEGVELVDTPGTGSVNEANTTEAEAAYEAMDAAIFVLTADPPISAAEKRLLARIARSSAVLFVVLNKADRLSSDELATAQRFSEKVVADAVGEPQPLYCCSARQALAPSVAPDSGTGGPRGIEELAEPFAHFLAADRRATLVTSVRRHAAALSAQLADEVAVTLGAARARGEDGARAVATFRQHLLAAQQHRKDAADLLRGESDRLLVELNEDAETCSAVVVTHALAALDDWLAGAPEELRGAGFEAAGHGAAAEAIRAEVEAWRTGWARRIQERLEAAEARLRERLDRDDEEVRPLARQLLGWELTTRRVPAVLAPSRHFHYEFRVDPAPLGDPSAAVRHHLPRRRGRARSLTYIRDLAGRQARQQVGRARADLQERLSASTRSLQTALSARDVDRQDRLLAALDRADDLAVASGAQVAARSAALADRRTRLQALAARIEDMERASEPAL